MFKSHKTMKVSTTLTLLTLLFVVNSNVSSAWSKGNEDYVRDACSVTRYQELCIRSLSPFSSTAKTSPSKWARAGVSVTITNAKAVSRYLTGLNKTHRSTIGKRNRVALLDCIELFQDALYELHKSLRTLRKLNAREFQEQMSDTVTWLSAALTDEDTCLDGFEGEKTGRKGAATVMKAVRRRALNSTYVTSNALALVNKLATDGL